MVWAAAPGEPAEHIWQPAADRVFLQEFNGKVETDQPVTAVAVLDETVYAVMNGGVYTLSGDGLSPVSSAPGAAAGLWRLGDALWVTTDAAVSRFAGSGWDKVFDGAMVDFCVHLGAVHGATR